MEVWKMLIYDIKCDALPDLVSFVQFKKHEKHPWKSVNFSKVAGFSLGYGKKASMTLLKILIILLSRITF